jgi:hypothetical protein
MIIALLVSLLASLSHIENFTAYAQRNSPSKTDNVIPIVTITHPTICTDLLASGNVTIQGTAYDTISGIEKVEAFVHTLPFDNEFPFQTVVPVSTGNWSQWSYTANIPDNGTTYRVLVMATDNEGNVNWDETLINSESMRAVYKAREIADSNKDEARTNNIALVTPTFTSAAYNYDSFYFFYYRYASVAEGVAITKDLNLMTGEIPEESEDAEIIDSFASRIKEFSPDSTISIIEDEVVHKGLIFSNDGRNAFDTLFMFHNEYVTQEEYDNLRNFVRNGGTIVFINSNIFYAEVKYDETSCTVTLVKGHNWEFDGTAVRKGVWERYLEENKEWMGSNFINRDISNPVKFDNNPFDYSHFEENELVNPNADVLIDYGAKFKVERPTNPLVIGGILQPDEYSDMGKRIATYELPYGKGKVIMLGIFGQNLIENIAFVDFFDNIILPRAIGDRHDLYVEGETFNLYSKMQDGRVSKVVLDKDSKSLIMGLDYEPNSSITDKTLSMTIPKRLLDANNADTSLADFTVLVEGLEVGYQQSYDDIERGLEISVPPGTTEVRVLGTQVVPEFSLPLLILAMLGIPLVLQIFHAQRKA